MTSEAPGRGTLSFAEGRPTMGKARPCPREVKILLGLHLAIGVIAAEPAFDAGAYCLESATTPLIENRGQINETARYYAQSSPVTVYFTSEAVVLDLREPLEERATRFDHESDSSAGRASLERVPRKGCSVWLRFRDANPSPRIEARDPAVTRYNYFHGNDPDGWRTDVPAFGEIIYLDLWPGIDLVFRMERGCLVYQLVTASGANPIPRALAYDIEGAERVTELSSGGLAIETSLGSILERDSGTGTGEGTISWTEASPRPHSASAVKDNPDALIWSTFLGGGEGGPPTPWDSPQAVALDWNGDVFVTGYTEHPDFPTTPGAYDTTWNSIEAFVSKLDSSGSGLLWSTFLGGYLADYAYAIAFDSSWNPVVTGVTAAGWGFPTTPWAYDSTGVHGDDAFVSKIGGSGSTLMASTYLGGDGDECGFGVGLDHDNNIVVTGCTDSPDFPTTPGAYDESPNGHYDVFVSELSPFCMFLNWSTVLGGSEWDCGNDLALEPAGYLMVTGFTESPGFPATPGAHDESLGGEKDAFVARLMPSGDDLDWCTFLGGGESEEGHAVALSSDGHPVVAGWTSSSDFPTTPGAYDETHNGGYDAFVAQLDPTGFALSWSSVLGGSDHDLATDLALNLNDNPVIAGYTFSPDFPTTPDAYDDSLGGEIDGFLAKLCGSGNTLFPSTLLGGEEYDYSHSLVLDSGRNAVVTGFTSSPDFPTTPGAFDETFNGGGDAFVSKMNVPFLFEVRDDGSGDFPTIQEAIDEAGSGDVIELCDGEFTGDGNRDLNLQGKAITLRSQSGNPELCIINCEGSGMDPHRGILIQTDEGPLTRVEGIQIVNGYMDSGSAVYCSFGPGPVISNCIFSGNTTAWGLGGALSCVAGSSPLITGCTISGNVSESGAGGVYSGSASPTIVDCVISGNSAVDDGGGLACYDSDLAITSSTITGNLAGGDGGALWCDQSSPTLENTILWCTGSGATSRARRSRTQSSGVTVRAAEMISSV